MCPPCRTGSGAQHRHRVERRYRSGFAWVLHFTPAIGIVGTREVRVLGIRDRVRSIAASPLERPVGDWLDFIVTTAAGDLVMRFPLEGGDAAAELLSP